MTPLYGPDLARIYHESHVVPIRSAGQATLALVKDSGLSAGAILDLGCAGGRFLRLATEAGHRATGVDTSEAFLEIARTTAPGARFMQGDIHEVALAEADVVTAFGQSLAYCSPEGEAPAIRRTISRIYETLRPGGLFVSDLFVSVRDGSPEANCRWRHDLGWVLWSETEEDRDESRLVQKFATFTQIFDEQWERSDEVHRIVVHDGDNVHQLLTEAGFDVKIYSHFGAYKVPPRVRVFVCRKPG